MARQGDGAVAVALDAFLWQPQARLDGFKSRALKANLLVSEGCRWHYEIEWSCVEDDDPPAATTLEVLVIGDVPPDLASHGHKLGEGAEGTIEGRQWDAVAFTASLSSDAVALAELSVVDGTLRLVHAQAVLNAAPAVWLCTAGMQALSNSSAHSRNAGLWGLARACRQERATLPAWCMDVHDNAGGLATVIRRHTLRLSLIHI